MATYLPGTADCDAVITAVRLVQARRSAATPVEFGLDRAAVLALADLVIAAMRHAAQLAGQEAEQVQDAWTDAWLAALLDEYTLIALGEVCDA